MGCLSSLEDQLLNCLLLVNGERGFNQTPFRWGATPLTGGVSGDARSASTATGVTTRRGGAGMGLFGTPMTVYRRGSGSQNTPPSGGVRRGRGGRFGAQSVLPSWYPRTPLGDITHVVQNQIFVYAIERRRRDGLILGSPTPTRIHPSPLGAQLEHEVSLVTPKQKLPSKTCKQSTLGKVPMILADIANQGGGESEFLTPPKKLLNSIDIVEKVVMEELHRLKRTPTAKRAEREKRVKTLMSMR